MLCTTIRLAVLRIDFGARTCSNPTATRLPVSRCQNSIRTIHPEILPARTLWIRTIFYVRMNEMSLSFDASTMKPMSLAERCEHPRECSPFPKTSLLHQACCRTNVTVEEIDFLLRQDPTSVSQTRSLSTLHSVVHPMTRRLVTIRVHSHYKYPLNIAMVAGAGSDVLSRLLQAAPEVLWMRDGDRSQTPLEVLLEYQPENQTTADEMLLIHPQLAALRNRAGQLPLLLATIRSCPWPMLRHLAIAHPPAMEQGPLPLLKKRYALSVTKLKAYLLAKGG